jgi:hypothetical protein
MLGKDREPRNAQAIDPTSARYVLTAFVLYAVKRWSPEEIARLFTELRVGNSQSWDGSRIRTILRKHKFVGIQLYGMTYHVREFDPKCQRTVVKTKWRPRSEWKVRRRRDWQIVPWSLGEEDIEYKRNVVAIAVSADGGIPQGGDIIYLEVPVEFKVLKALGEAAPRCDEPAIGP